MKTLDIKYYVLYSITYKTVFGRIHGQSVEEGAVGRMRTVRAQTGRVVRV